MKRFDLHEIYHEDRPLSWSGISSFEWNPMQWYQKYVLKQEQPMTPELILGKEVDERIQKDPTYLPQVPRYPIMQHEMRTKWRDIPLLGFSDQYRPERSEGPYDDFFTPLGIRDLKTGRKPWDQKRADETGQLTMYLFMLYLKDKKIDVENAELYIDWLPTHIKDGKLSLVEPVVVHTFETHRTMQQVLEFAQRIERTWKAMEVFAQKQSTLLVHDIKDF